MEKVTLNGELELSRIIHGYWRLREWNIKGQELLKLIQQVVELGITTFDHADIYGNYSCETIFGEALSFKKELRKNIQLVTKCGIKLLSDKYPQRKVKIYDYSFNHIVTSVENSLRNFKTDYIDLLLLHRPSPYFDPQEVQRAFAHLKQSGKVLHFGVSNFTPNQFEMLNNFWQEGLVTNQVEISPLHLEHFKNGNMDFFLKEKLFPMVWSPVARGRVFNPVTEHEKQVNKAITEVAEEMNCTSPDTIVYSWLLKHPANVLPIIGSQKTERIKAAVDALNLNMTLEQWFKIYIAANGEELP